MALRDWFDGPRVARLALVLGLVGVELWLVRDLTSESGMTGFTLTRSHSVAPPLNARVSRVLVDLGATVEAGQLIAELDPTEIDDAIAAASAERQRVLAEMQAASLEQGRDAVNLERRFAAGSERASAQLAIAESMARTAAAELAAVDAEIKEQSELVTRQITTVEALRALQLRRAALHKQVDTAENILDVLRANVVAADRRAVRVPGADPGDILAPLAASLRATEIRLDQLTRQRGKLRLRAPVAGFVQDLLLKPGDLAGPELPVAVVVASDTARVLACIPEARLGGVEVDSEAELVSLVGHERTTGAVESITAAVAPLPARCQDPGSRAVALGRLAVIALDRPAGGLPGQTQLVSFHGRRGPGRASSRPRPAPAVAAGETSPSRIEVPAEMLLRSRFEPSGLVWVAALDRYLLVSDDTGQRERDKRAPWLFTMSADGVVDPEPLVVQGVAAFDDLESIAAGEGGSLWVMASQSVSRKDNRPPSRQHLARLLPVAGGGYRVEALVDVAALLDAAPVASRAALGVPDTRRLDVEGTAWRDGALYFGLKAPLDDEGRALIWKVAQPDRLLAGDLAGAELTVWSRVRLSVEVDGQAVPGGISDLLFLDETTLLIAVTASGRDPARQAGALVRARPTGGELTPERLATFPDLKPEGVTLGPRGDAITVVFDRGAEPSLWLDLPLRELLGGARAAE